MHRKWFRKQFIATMAALTALLCMAGGAFALPANPTLTLDPNTITLNQTNLRTRPATITATVTTRANPCSLSAPSLHDEGFAIDWNDTHFAANQTSSTQIDILYTDFVFTQKRKEIPLTMTLTEDNTALTATATGTIIVELLATGSDPEMIDHTKPGDRNPDGTTDAFTFVSGDQTLVLSRDIFTFNTAKKPTLRLREPIDGLEVKLDEVSGDQFRLVVDASKVAFAEGGQYGQSAELKLSLDGAKPLFYDLSFINPASAAENISVSNLPILTRDDNNNTATLSVWVYNADPGAVTPEIALSPDVPGITIGTPVQSDPVNQPELWSVPIDASKATFPSADQIVATVTASLPGTDLVSNPPPITLGGTEPLVRYTGGLDKQFTVDDFDIGRVYTYYFDVANTNALPQLEKTGMSGLTTPELGDYYLSLTIDDFTPAAADRTAKARVYVDKGVQDFTVEVTFKGTGSADNDVIAPTTGANPDGVALAIVTTVPQAVADAVGNLIVTLPAGSVVSAEAAPTADTGGMIPLAGSLRIDVPAAADDALALTYTVTTAKLTESDKTFDGIAALSPDRQMERMNTLDAGGLRAIYEYVDNASGTATVTLIGMDGIDRDGAPLTWARALSADIVRFEDDKLKINYVVTNAAGAPTTVANFIVIPDGRADDRIKDPLWIAQG
ncbi:hypothetical protein LJC31_08720, partial [Synergistaceae bacterium OttesenSCG-928-I11]|nr:hypothetical protein [Synergistaceae bacterium OttesenSCG-928-I11]